MGFINQLISWGPHIEGNPELSAILQFEFAEHSDLTPLSIELVHLLSMDFAKSLGNGRPR